MWKGQAARLAFAPQDGIEVIVTGRVTTYPGRSKYQIVIETMELAGEGALMALFEKLKAQLVAEGLFEKSLARFLEPRSEEHTSELQSLMRISFAAFCLKQTQTPHHTRYYICLSIQSHVTTNKYILN